MEFKKLEKSESRKEVSKIRFDYTSACDAWLQPKFAHNEEIDFPLSTHKVCHQHEGWTKFDKLEVADQPLHPSPPAGHTAAAIP